MAPAAFIWVALFAVPLVSFFVFSFWSVRTRIMRPDLTLKNYAATFTDYGDVLVTTLGIAFIIASVTTLLAFAFAYAIRFRAGRFGDTLLFVTLIAIFGGYLVKIYAWKSILGRDGIINGLLLWAGVIDEPLSFLIYSPSAVVVTLTYFLLPFAVLPIYGSMRSIPDDLIEAARDLGATSFMASRDVVLPLCERGINVAFLFSFLISAGDYVTPRFVGGGASMMGHFIETQFSFGFNWPMGSAMSFTLLAASLLVVVSFRTLLRFAVRR
ncbi:MAG TPA: ABC transporter permease [Alphaproteobacteria bacterium]|nr:ABC transporter permease [Alphaproteobacteria bacterium]